LIQVNTGGKRGIANPVKRNTTTLLKLTSTAHAQPIKTSST